MAQINKPTDHFNTKLYTGNGSTNNITGVGFKPDWVWLKHRNNPTAYNHRVYDSVRGATKNLSPNGADAEITSSTELTSFDSDGFTLGSGSAANQNTINHVSWNWLAGGTASSNTDGTITSSVSANQNAGFSVATWTGAGAVGTVGHGLGKAPEFVITKKRNNVGNWNCYHASLGSTKYIYLNSSNAPATDSGRWNDTDPTSSVMSLGTDDNLTGNGDNIIGYFFTSIKGYSKIGSYTGNGSADGTFVYTGFKPAWLMYKQTNASGESWIMHDNKRGNQGAGANPQDLRLLANATNTEADEDIDFLSNGFKCRVSGAFQNGSGSTYIYIAFAEHPLVGTNNIPATAR